MKPYYTDEWVTLYHGDCFDVLPQIAAAPITFVYADPPYGLNVVKTSGVLAGRDNGNGLMAERSVPLRSDTAQPFGGKGRTQGVRPSNGMLYPQGSITRKPEPTGTVGSGKPFGSKAETTGTVVSANGKRMIDCGHYHPIIGDETTETAERSSAICLSTWPKAVHVWWGGNYYANALPPSSCWIVWDKENTGNFADAELAWTNQQTAVRICRHMWNGLLKASERGEKRIHPTQKPVVVACWILEKYGKPGDLVLDPFAGSGSSLVAAKKLARKSIGIEASEHYCELIAKRLSQGVLELV